MKVRALISNSTPEEKRIEVDDVLARTKSLFPNAELVCEDSFERERIDKFNIIENCRRQGRPLSAGEALLRDIENKRQLHGRGSKILIRCSRGNILGNVTEIVLAFYTKVEFDPQTRAKLELLYEELGRSFSETDAQISKVSMDMLEDA